MDPIIQIENLSCNYRKFQAVRNLTLEVPVGSIYAFLGTNGAGKTTTIQTLLNLIPPSSGTARVLGVDSTQLGPRELAQIGYVSENQELPEQLTVDQLIQYCRALYPTWDDLFCQRLAQKLVLPMNRPIKNFSRGMKIKAALLISLAYRPKLLLMDEPFSGLDPLVRDDVIQGMLELSEQENWTAFISSHDIDEVERLADYVGIIDQGQLLLSESSDRLRTRFRRIDAILSEGAPPKLDLDKVTLGFEATGFAVRWVDTQFTTEEDLGLRIQHWLPGCKAWTSAPLTLREIFVAITRSQRPSPSSL